ncbi:MAG: hypothetical protein H6883_00420 [Rhodobiaceae bacterium]|nr:hypothetical protein [Rhodobiaceae bacterium]
MKWQTVPTALPPALSTAAMRWLPESGGRTLISGDEEPVVVAGLDQRQCDGAGEAVSIDDPLRRRYRAVFVGQLRRGAAIEVMFFLDGQIVDRRVQQRIVDVGEWRVTPSVSIWQAMAEARHQLIELVSSDKFHRLPSVARFLDRHLDRRHRAFAAFQRRERRSRSDREADLDAVGFGHRQQQAQMMRQQRRHFIDLFLKAMMIPPDFWLCLLKGGSNLPRHPRMAQERKCCFPLHMSPFSGLLLSRHRLFSASYPLEGF